MWSGAGQAGCPLSAPVLPTIAFSSSSRQTTHSLRGIGARRARYACIAACLRQHAHLAHQPDRQVTNLDQGGCHLLCEEVSGTHRQHNVGDDCRGVAGRYDGERNRTISRAAACIGGKHTQHAGITAKLQAATRPAPLEASNPPLPSRCPSRATYWLRPQSPSTHSSFGRPLPCSNFQVCSCKSPGDGSGAAGRVLRGAQRARHATPFGARLCRTTLQCSRHQRTCRHSICMRRHHCHPDPTPLAPT